MESLARVAIEATPSPTIGAGDGELRYDHATLDAAWRVAWKAEPVEGFPLETREDRAAFQYGKDCAVVAIKNLAALGNKGEA